ncbi:hypothetical protein DW352_25710 [Pseudolabrys taiwanensis]|uniref:Uncharacterized protein n=1 Tax=Pseudolabrys taiwanensis TaxID=331696 RepID=A0A346A378_9HYPH|nr:hypothetical protein [Pseudolabrys taiwanensis]AXK83625.1 hypothetical protein DW352_25710 [Pseudolabrys taiwanensis]
MGLTLLAIPFILLGIFVRPYAEGAERCFKIELLSKSAYCFEQASYMPEIVKYGCMAVGLALIYAGRRQIKQARGE